MFEVKVEPGEFVEALGDLQGQGADVAETRSGQVGFDRFTIFVDDELKLVLG